MLIKHIMLAFLAFFAGLGVSAGTFAFILIAGVVPRMLRKTNLAKKVILVETLISLGGIIGNAISVFPDFRILGMSGSDLIFMRIIGHMIIVLYGLCAGVFVGCLSVALAEILNTFPILFRRIRIKRGLSWIMVALAFGKVTGALFYFLTGYRM